MPTISQTAELRWNSSASEAAMRTVMNPLYSSFWRVGHGWFVSSFCIFLKMSYKMVKSENNEVISQANTHISISWIEN